MIIFKVVLLFNAVVRRLLNILTTFYWSLFLNEFGTGSKIYKGSFFRIPKDVSIGRQCLIQFNVRFGSEIPNSKLDIKDNVQINSDVFIDYSGGLIIENNVVISKGGYILTHSHGYDPKSKPVKKPLIIKKGVWIGANVTICENVSEIGENAIIATGSILTKNVPGNTIFGGNPAKFIKSI